MNAIEQFDLNAQMNFGDDLQDDDVITQKTIHISTLQRTLKKKSTIITELPDDIDLNLVLKAWKKLFHCVGSVKTDPKSKGLYILLNGDHRQECYDFLIHEGIGTKETIKMHGADI